MENIFEFKNVSFKYKQKLFRKPDDFSIKNVNLSMEAGYIMGLVGKNSAGKSTLVDLLGRQLKNYEGDIYVDGKNIKDNRRYLFDNVAFISETQVFYNRLNCDANGDMLGVYFSNWDEELFGKTLTKLKVPRYTQVDKLSKGEFIKFQFAFAIARKPKLLVMDEPTAGLDPVFRREFLDRLQGLVEEYNTSVLFSTHITSDLDKVADYIALVDNGEIVFKKDIEQLRDEYGKEFHINNLFKYSINNVEAEYGPTKIH